MDLLKKLLGDGVPKWAQPLSPKQFSEFQAQVMLTFSNQNLNPDINWEEGKAIMAPLEMFFHNLLARWREAEPVAQQALVSEFIQTSVQAITAKEMKLSDCLEDLLIRIYDFEIPHVGNFVRQPIGKFLFATLVVDNPTSTRSVTRDQLAESGMTVEELFDIAKKNLRSKITPEAERRVGPMGELTMVTADYFGASFITILEALTDLGETYWVATPNKHLLLALKPQSHDEESLLKFLELANRFSNQIPNDYILPFVLEYRDDVFRDLCRRTEHGIERHEIIGKAMLRCY